MVIFRVLFLTGLTLQAFAGPVYEKADEINGVDVQTGKVDSTRFYQGTISKQLLYPIDIVIKGITNFHEKCNNSHKEHRELTDKNYECKYHNDNLVETQVIRDIKKDGWTKDPNEVDRFVLGRRVYNRGDYSYYELVQIFQTTNLNKQKVITIRQRMLNDQEAKTYVDIKFEKESAFDQSYSTFTLTELAPSITQFEYNYQAETEHWMLNKEISVPQVFSSISKSINDLVKTVDTESAFQNRDVASN